MNFCRETIPSRGDLGITAECLRECDILRERCLAVSVEPLRSSGQRCYSLDRSSEADSSVLHPAVDLVHFEKICLRGTNTNVENVLRPYRIVQLSAHELFLLQKEAVENYGVLQEFRNMN